MTQVMLRPPFPAAGGDVPYVTTAKLIEANTNSEGYTKSNGCCADSDQFTFAAFMRLPVGGGLQDYRFLYGSNGTVDMRWRKWYGVNNANDNTFGIDFYDSGFTGFAFGPEGYGSHGLVDGDWFAFMLSIDYSGSGVPPNIQMWVHKTGAGSAINIGDSPQYLFDDNGPVTMELNQFTALGKGPVWSASQMRDFEICEIFMDSSYVDWSDANERAKFVDSNGKPVGLGGDGSALTGSQPDVYAPDGDLSNNLGSYGNWTEVGTIGDASTSPSD